ncbi:cysteine--tRNA ligase [Metallosphaera tengchongensis]|uniref:Cysteine--tRNA ligase n=1 Tax=Metallosphaera tengchongensis TaxID=1532350 RepID=A0A6N0NW54_9CREN|nr:cysteine--tRNA ligase [Metallosphaera tengchongensis]QKR00992.1 cysteine--tRNA ligase [Metallosphaera tengchongensis]
MLRLFNTLGRRLEEFVPYYEDTVRMYVCGPTVYDEVHIGHGRTFVAFDAMTRYLRRKGYNVIRIQNITDIDDKIINKAKETGVTWEEVSELYSKSYLEMMTDLKVRIDLHPKVSTHIKEIIEFIEKLIEKGHAYLSNGSVYFDVNSYPKYGELSNTRMEAWGQEEEAVKEKRNPYDFALWKANKPGEPFWESPWGKGRPGWHIECSTMSTRYLGSKIDIHGGGMDLVFPHHENERAQTESLTGGTWVKYWLHVAFLTIRKEKMSKSKGNIVPLKEALGKYGPSVLRYWFLSSQYRTSVEYSEENLEQSSRALQRLKDSISILRKIIQEGPKYYAKDEDIRTQKQVVSLVSKFNESMDNDFDTANALSAIHELASVTFSKLQYSEDPLGALIALDGFRQFNEVFGVMDEEFSAETERIEKILDSVVEIRNILRKRQMYDLSDQIRDILLKNGVKLLDSKEGSTWRFQ